MLPHFFPWEKGHSPLKIIEEGKSKRQLIQTQCRDGCSFLVSQSPCIYKTDVTLARTVPVRISSFIHETVAVFAPSPLPGPPPQCSQCRYSPFSYSRWSLGAEFITDFTIQVEYSLSEILQTRSVLDFGIWKVVEYLEIYIYIYNKTHDLSLNRKFIYVSLYKHSFPIFLVCLCFDCDPSHGVRCGISHFWWAHQHSNSFRFWTISNFWILELGMLNLYMYKYLNILCLKSKKM
jgi:hypothetical protein